MYVSASLKRNALFFPFQVVVGVLLVYAVYEFIVAASGNDKPPIEFLSPVALVISMVSLHTVICPAWAIFISLFFLMTNVDKSPSMNASVTSFQGRCIL